MTIRFISFGIARSKIPFLSGKNLQKWLKKSYTLNLPPWLHHYLTLNLRLPISPQLPPITGSSFHCERRRA
jgi:hypothetical protein